MTFKQYKKNILQDPRSTKLKFNKTDDRFYYVYRITDLETGMHYYGSRRTALNPRDDLGVQYFSTSSIKEFKNRQKANPSHFKYKVIKVYDNPGDMILHESLLHKKLNVARNKIFYNKANQTPFKFDSVDNTGKVIVKDKGGNTFRTSTDDPRYLSGELVGMAHKRSIYIETRSGKRISAPTDDPRIKTGEIISANKNKRLVVDNNGKYYMVKVDDPRLETGELKSLSIGKCVVKYITTGESFMTRVDDPRLETGEIVPFWKGRKHRKEVRQKLSEHAKKRKGVKSSNANLTIIYNDKKQLFLVCVGNFVEKCRELGLPYDSFNVSIKTGNPITGRYDVSKPFKGYAGMKMKLSRIKWSTENLINT